MDKNRRNGIQNENEIAENIENNMNNNSMYYMDEMNNNVYSNRYNNGRYDNNWRYDNYYDNDRRYDRRYDRDYYDRMRYYQYPYCDRYGRCENPIWWLFWPLFFL